jgi:hypothetical protein
MRFKLMLPTAAILFCACGGQAWAAPVMVTCGPGLHTIVRDSFVRGEPVTRVECVRSHGDYRTGYSPYSRSAYSPYSRWRGDRPHRSWGKTALTIGGGASTGAGVGGLIHGKRGALIGAALGGGVASLYESAHRR